jgi:hypothetical protein
VPNVFIYSVTMATCATTCLFASPTIIPNTTLASCDPIVRKFGISRIVFLDCNISQNLVMPPASALAIATQLTTYYNTGTANNTATRAFQSTKVLTNDIATDDPAEIILNDCGSRYFLSGRKTLTFTAKEAFNVAVTPTPAAPALTFTQGERAFWNYFSDKPNKFSFGLVDCDGFLWYITNPTNQNTFANGTIFAKEVLEALPNNCGFLLNYEVKLDFACGAQLTQILDLKQVPALAAWL